MKGLKYHKESKTLPPSLNHSQVFSSKIQLQTDIVHSPKVCSNKFDLLCFVAIGWSFIVFIGSISCQSFIELRLITHLILVMCS